MALNPDDFDLRNCHFEDGKIVADADQNWFDFSPKGLVLDMSKVHTVTVTFELIDGDLNNQDIYAYSLLPSVDWDNSSWYDLYVDDHWTEGATSYTFELSRDHHDFIGALVDGETRVILEAFRQQRVTNVTWTVADAPKLLYGPPIFLDDSPEEVYVDGPPDFGVWEEYHNYYSTACKVFDDVVLAAWCHNWEGPDDPARPPGGSHRPYEAVAVRHVDSKPPTAVKGTVHRGPDVRELPEWPEYWNTYPYYDPDFVQSAEILNAARISDDGLCLIQVGQNAWGMPVMGYIVRVNQATLDVTFVRAVALDGMWTPQEWAWPVCYGPGRTMVQCMFDHALPQGVGAPRDEFFQDGRADRFMVAFAPNGSELARRYIQSTDTTKPGWTGGIPTPEWYLNFQWNDVMCIADAGTHFVSVMLGGPYPNYTIDIWKHDVVDNLPAENPELIVRMPRGTFGGQPRFDFDSTYCCAMPNGLVYVLENDNAFYGQARFWVIDVNARTMTQKAYVSAPASGFAARLMDWMSIEPFDENKAYYGVAEFWNSDDRGYRVGLFDGTNDEEPLSHQQLIFPYYANRDPGGYRDRDTYSYHTAESYHLGDGRILAILNFGEDDGPLPASPERPVQLDQTQAVAARLFNLPKAEGQLRGTRRHYRRNS